LQTKRHRASNPGAPPPREKTRGGIVVTKRRHSAKCEGGVEFTAWEGAESGADDRNDTSTRPPIDTTLLGDAPRKGPVRDRKVIVNSASK